MRLKNVNNYSYSYNTAKKGTVQKKCATTVLFFCQFMAIIGNFCPLLSLDD